MGWGWKFVLLLLCMPAFAHDEFNRTFLALKLFTDTPGYDIAFKSVEDGKTLKYRPNVNQTWGLRLALRDWVSVGYGFKIDQQDEEKIKKGHTDYQDWRFDFNFRHFSVGLNYQEYNGFYIDNSSSADPAWTSSLPQIQFPDMRLHTGSVNFTYVWSPEDFSLIAASDQLVRQRQSGGSFLMGMSVSDTEFVNKGAIIPAPVRSEYGVDQNIEAGRFLVVTAKAGYGYTLVIGQNGFLSGTIQVGGGQQRRIYRDATTERSSWHVATKTDAMVSTGYNGDRFFGGIKAMGDATIYRTESIEISSGLWSLSLFIGGRI